MARKFSALFFSRFIVLFVAIGAANLAMNSPAFAASGLPVIVQDLQDQTGPAGGTVTFTVVATGGVLDYTWFRNDVSIPDANETSSPTYQPTITHADDGAKYHVEITNNFGTVKSREAVLHVQGSVPVPTITLPVTNGPLVKGGDVIQFAGTATDAEDGTLPASAFTWSADMGVAPNIIQALPPTTGVKSGSFVLLPATDPFPGNIRVHLQVKDSAGNIAETFTQVPIIESIVRATTLPAGLVTLFDGKPGNFLNANVGFVHQVSVPSPQTLNGHTYDFQSWSDGGAQTHSFTLPADHNTVFTATFVERPPQALSWEAEALTRTTAGASASVQTDAAASGGKWVQLQVDSIGDHVDFVVPNVPAGTYRVNLRYKTNKNRGVMTLKIDGTQLGGTLDQHATTASYASHAFGTLTFANIGNHTLRLTVTGKASGATDYDLSADSFTFDRLLTP